MAKGEKNQRPAEAKPTTDLPIPAQPAQPEQGAYGSGGSYGVGGGFDDEEGRDTRSEDPDERAARAARSAAQQEGEQVGGFEREVDADAARPPFREAARTPGEEQLAAKKQPGSRL